ncbi:zinc finger protein OZF [Orussus abietinus]|uniref:zinc finger protein OZF n=1 Tax=Orussus abietinus TaxID=222816 RepID=UPI000626B05E|nr:zinc finger protein OZF [Orussus abietinus]
MVYPCRICGKVFFNKKTMWNHTGHCGKERQFPCYICGKRFKQKHHLTKHLKTVHKPENAASFHLYRDNKNWFHR